MSNPFEESFKQFLLTGELPSAEKMRQEVSKYEEEKKNG